MALSQVQGYFVNTAEHKTLFLSHCILYIIYYIRKKSDKVKNFTKVRVNYSDKYKISSTVTYPLYLLLNDPETVFLNFIHLKYFSLL